MAKMYTPDNKPSEQPVSRGMFQTSHGKTPLLMDRQLNQRDPVPSVPKNVAVTENVKCKANRNDRTYMVGNDCDNAEKM